MQLELQVSTANIFGVTITRIFDARSYFEEDKRCLEGLVRSVRSAFGRPDMSYEDIYNHLVTPEYLYALSSGSLSDDSVFGMASYNKTVLSGLPALVVEGIAIDPAMQKRGIFKEVTDLVVDTESLICLRTQNPNMYKALQNYCSSIYPSLLDLPDAIRVLINELARYMKCEIDKNGVTKNYYGGLFYGEKPFNHSVTGLFNQLGVNIEEGDGLLVLGVR
jgi:hypothetical protein